jgi:hypothetical protein
VSNDTRIRGHFYSVGKEGMRPYAVGEEETCHDAVGKEGARPDAAEE